jgi:hypothetical protein
MLDFVTESGNSGAGSATFKDTVPDRPARRLTERRGALANFH